MRAVLISAALLGVMVVHSRADACSYRCTTAGMIPLVDGKTMPGNVPGFPVRPLLGDASFTAANMTLVDADGVLVPTTHEFTSGFDLLKPAAALAPGNYTLRVPDCSETGGERHVSIVASAPLPTKSGTAHAVVSRKTVTTFGQGLCLADADAAVAHIEVTPDPELAPWISMIDWSVSVDGTPWRGPYFEKYGSGYPPQIYDPLTLFAQCAVIGTTPPDVSLTEGAHHVSVTPRIIGAPPLPPMELDVTLSCGNAASDSGAPPLDGGTRADDLDAGNAGANDAAPNGSASGSGSGCASSETPVTSTGTSLVFAATLTALWRRRRNAKKLRH